MKLEDTTKDWYDELLKPLALILQIVTRLLISRCANLSIVKLYDSGARQVAALLTTAVQVSSRPCQQAFTQLPVNPPHNMRLLMLRWRALSR